MNFNITQPRTIALVYLLIGFTWIISSDIILETAHRQDVDKIISIEQIKGLFYVSVTGVLLYLLLKRNQKRIFTQQEILSQLFKNKDMGLFKVNPDGVFLMVSENFAHMLGYTVEDLKLIKIREITHPEDQEHDAEIWRSLIQGKTDSFHYEKRFVHRKTGSPVWVEINGNVQRDEKRITYIVSMVQNLMPIQINRNKAASELREKNALINSTDDLIWSVDSAFSLVSFNNAYRDFIINLTGIKPEPGMTGTTDFKTVMNESSRWEHYYTRVLRKESFSMVERIKIEEDERYIEITFNPIIEKNKVLGVSCFGRDITSIMKVQNRLKETLRLLEESNNFVKTSLNNIPIGVAVNYIDSGEATLVNQKFSEIYGWPIADLTDIENFFNIVYPDPEYREKIKSQIQADISSGDPKRMEWKGIMITTKTGEKRIINAKNIPVFEQNLMISTVVDVTELTKHIRTIEKQNGKLTEIAWMQSHKVRSPLAKIIALVNLILDETPEAVKDQKTFHYLSDSAEELDSIIRDISDKTRTVDINK
ncbi:MAG: PAS domain S-box protein [Salibacteraceae bacterium]